MRWSMNLPKQQGWYIVTLHNSMVMPMYLQEYPKGNFTWQGLACGSEVIASVKFPKPYGGE